jgi:hypothetical protein
MPKDAVWLVNIQCMIGWSNMKLKISWHDPIQDVVRCQCIAKWKIDKKKDSTNI